jgi:TolB-like protein
VARAGSHTNEQENRRVRASLSLLAAAAALLALPGAPAAETLRVALLPIAVHSAEPDAAYVSAGLEAMLSARLEHSGRISVVRVEGDAGAGDQEAAVTAARESGADYVLFGSFTQFGEGASLDMRCAPLGAAPGPDSPRQVFIHSGSIGEIIPRLDELAEKLARYVETGAATGTAAAPPQAGAPAPGPVAGPAAAGGNGGPGAAAPGALEDLQRRVEALERSVYERGAAAPSGAER